MEYLFRIFFTTHFILVIMRSNIKCHFIKALFCTYQFSKVTMIELGGTAVIEH